MSEKDLLRNYANIVVIIDFCLSQKFILPALILIYSSIDSISWIADFENLQSVRKRFELWVNTWMLHKYPLPCTATELYAARCGILHTLTPDSDLNDTENVKKIMYAWGSASQRDLDESINILGKTDYVAVHVNDILHSFRNGFVDFVESIQADEIKQELFTSKANKHLTNLEPLVLKEFLDFNGRDTNGNSEW